MANNSAIEWTDASWNVITGCDKVSTGCKHCYAETLSNRLKSMGQDKYKNNFKYTEHEKYINQPEKWKKPRKIFVNSMSDTFHEKANFKFILKYFNTMLRVQQHIYQVLTKRSKRMIEFSNIFEKQYNQHIPKHIWMGVSVENEQYLYRIDDLRKVKCSMRFISFEPLLDNINVDLNNIDWAIIGGESGYNYRALKKEWVVNLIKQCKEQHVPVFFKQWGGINPKAGGYKIDGKTYREYP